MEQQQIKVSFSVGTKLLVSVVTLLFFVILFLNVSTIFLFREDKMAYTFRTQSTEALLAGRDFTGLAKQSLSTLRTLLGAVDPGRAFCVTPSSTIQTVVDNQSNLAAVGFYRVKLDGTIKQVLGQVAHAQRVNTLGLKLEDYGVPPPWMKKIAPQLVKRSFGFINLSKVGQVPMLAVLLADVGLKSSAAGMPVAVGLLPLDRFGADLATLRITVATSSGWVLYDSDTAVLYANENLSENPLFKAAVSSTLESGAMQYEFGDEHYLGSYLNPGLDLVVLSKTDWRKAMKPTYAIIEKCLLLGLMAIAAAIVFALLFSKTLTAPLGRLYEATKQVGSGNFDLALSEKGTDELTALSFSFNLMSKKIGELIQESIEKVKLENELQIASTVQQTLIPPKEFQNEWIKIASAYRPAEQCGGDWWGFFGVGNKVVIMIADATGHGLPCALITASARGCCSIMHKWAQEDPAFTYSPGAMLSFANRVVYEAAQGAIMMTFFIAVIDREAKTITYSNAGHNSPWLFKKGDDGKFTPVSLTVAGQRVGEVRENDDFQEGSVTIGEQDVLFLYTDGLTEGTNLQGEQYGKMTARRRIAQSVAQGPSVVIDDLMEDFGRHNGDKSLDDDVTIAAVTLLEGSLA